MTFFSPNLQVWKLKRRAPFVLLIVSVTLKRLNNSTGQAERLKWIWNQFQMPDKRQWI